MECKLHEKPASYNIVLRLLNKKKTLKLTSPIDYYLRKFYRILRFKLEFLI